MSQFVSIASSADGRKLTAAGNLIYTSIDSGTTWIPHDLSDPTMPVVPRFTWSSVAVAADGKKLVGAIAPVFSSSSLTYTSTDGGASWTTLSGAPLNCYLFASSGDGATLLAASSTYGMPSGLCVSRDSGTTWSRTGPAAYEWSVLTSSADGTKLFAVGMASSFCRRTLGQLDVSNAPSIRLLAASGDGQSCSGRHREVLTLLFSRLRLHFKGCRRNLERDERTENELDWLGLVGGRNQIIRLELVDLEPFFPV
jgi:hypothetical protein